MSAQGSPQSLSTPSLPCSICNAPILQSTAFLRCQNCPNLIICSNCYLQGHSTPTHSNNHQLTIRRTDGQEFMAPHIPPYSKAANNPTPQPTIPSYPPQYQAQQHQSYAQHTVPSQAISYSQVPSYGSHYPGLSSQPIPAAMYGSHPAQVPQYGYPPGQSYMMPVGGAQMYGAMHVPASAGYMQQAVNPQYIQMQQQQHQQQLDMRAYKARQDIADSVKI